MMINKALAKIRQPNEQHQLYQQAMLAHHKSPVGFDKKIAMTHQSKGVNPACGDEIIVALEIVDGKISDVAFYGDSCAICRASASIMCQQLNGEKVDASEQLAEQLMSTLNNNITMIGELAENFEPLLTVQKFPVRKQCALLPWSTILSAIKKPLI